MRKRLGKWAINQIYSIDALEGLRALPTESIQCCVTSPPYWNQRDYGVAGQYGHEATPEAYIEQLVELLTQVYRVLKQDGTLWLNLGDAYWGSGKAGSNPEYHKRHTAFGRPAVKGRFGIPTNKKHPVLKSKDLIGLPWQVALALRNQGWYLRQDIIWHKPNPLPESVTDRCTKCHEYLFLLSKSRKYYFDHEAIKQPLQPSSIQRLSQDVKNQKGSNRMPGKSNGPMRAAGRVIGGKKHLSFGQPASAFSTRNQQQKNWENKSGLANKRSVWTIATQPFRDAHFATFPVELCMNCIKAGSRPGDLILDPFMGAGTTALGAVLLERNFIGFELNPSYIVMANKRIDATGNLFHQ